MIMQHVFEGHGAPTEAPTALGQHYIDTTTGTHYNSVGTASVEDWKAGGEGGGDSAYGPYSLTNSKLILGDYEKRLFELRDALVEDHAALKAKYGPMTDGGFGDSTFAANEVLRSIPGLLGPTAVVDLDRGYRHEGALVDPGKNVYDVGEILVGIDGTGYSSAVDVLFNGDLNTQPEWETTPPLLAGAAPHPFGRQGDFTITQMKDFRYRHVVWSKSGEMFMTNDLTQIDGNWYNQGSYFGAHTFHLTIDCLKPDELIDGVCPTASSFEFVCVTSMGRLLRFSLYGMHELDYTTAITDTDWASLGQFLNSYNGIVCGDNLTAYAIYKYSYGNYIGFNLSENQDPLAWQRLVIDPTEVLTEGDNYRIDTLFVWDNQYFLTLNEYQGSTRLGLIILKVDFTTQTWEHLYRFDSEVSSVAYYDFNDTLYIYPTTGSGDVSAVSYDGTTVTPVTLGLGGIWANALSLSSLNTLSWTPSGSKQLVGVVLDSIVMTSDGVTWVQYPVPRFTVEGWNGSYLMISDGVVGYGSYTGGAPEWGMTIPSRNGFYTVTLEEFLYEQPPTLEEVPAYRVSQVVHIPTLDITVFGGGVVNQNDLGPATVGADFDSDPNSPPRLYNQGVQTGIRVQLDCVNYNLPWGIDSALIRINQLAKIKREFPFITVDAGEIPLPIVFEKDAYMRQSAWRLSSFVSNQLEPTESYYVLKEHYVLPMDYNGPVPLKEVRGRIHSTPIGRFETTDHKVSNDGLTVYRGTTGNKFRFTFDLEAYTHESALPVRVEVTNQATGKVAYDA